LQFFFGLTLTAKTGTSYVYLLEMIPKNRTTAVSTSIMLVDGACLIWISIYYLYISKNWLYLLIFGAFLTGVSNIAMFLMPESPKFYYGQKNYDLARKSLRYIARFNKVKDYQECVFDSEYNETALKKSKLSN